MQIIDPETDLDEALPDKVVIKGLLILPLDITLEIPVLAILHYDVDVVALDEGVVVANDEGRVQFAKKFNFL